MDDLLVRVFPDLPAVSRAAAEDFVALARDAVAARGRFCVTLSGGRTPKEMHRLLASEFRDQVDWSKVHIFFGDERFVPLDDPQSNYRMARETLLEQVPIPDDQIHPMPTEGTDPEVTAGDYTLLLQSQFGSGVPEFDLVLLGMGPDGHTASIFPGTPAVRERDRLVMPVRAQVEPHQRISLTHPVLTAARRTLFLVTGADKRPVWERIQANPAEAAHEYPAAMVSIAARDAAWYIDQSLER